MTTVFKSADRRPGFRSWGIMIVSELKMVMRDTAGLVIPIALPLLMMVMNGIGASSQELPGGLTVFDVYVMPLVLTIVVATIGVVNMPSFLSYYRKAEILKRLSVTPAHPMMVLVSQVVVSVLQTLVGIALAITIAVMAFDANLPMSPWTTVGVFSLAGIAFYSVGMLIAAVSPTPNGTVAIGLIAFFAMGAVGGMFGGMESLPEPVARVGEVLPFGAAVQAVGTAWAGEAPRLIHVIGLVGVTVVAGALSARFFRWQ